MSYTHPIASPLTKVSEFPGLLSEAAQHTPEALVVALSGTPDLSGTCFVVIDASGGDVALTLPSPTTDETLQHRRITIARSPGGTNATVSLDGGAPIAVAEGAAMDVISDGDRWYVVG